MATPAGMLIGRIQLAGRAPIGPAADERWSLLPGSLLNICINHGKGYTVRGTLISGYLLFSEPDMIVEINTAAGTSQRGPDGELLTCAAQSRDP